MRSIVVEAPASSANLGPGFDVFAIALGRPTDSVTVEAKDAPEAGVTVRVDAGTRLPLRPEENSSGAVVLKIAKDFGIKCRIEVGVRKGVPVGVGLGSSAASAAAAAVAMDRLFDLKLGDGDLVYYAGMGELASSGVAHHDNVSASLFGGFTVVGRGERPRVVKVTPPAGLALCVVTPELEMPERKTEYARSVLPREVDLGSMVNTVASSALVLCGFALKDIAMIGEGMRDEVVEPARSAMVKGYADVRRAALKAGAAGACISGAGPSILALTDAGAHPPQRIVEEMVAAFGRHGVRAEGFATSPGGGAKVVGVD
ncbi:MAG: homoserine kinase [Nitrososphaerota archaeon]|nr:homoserine kinase [Nitrososphaerota archaeon]MDG6939651.1 homoserine kinase [Nitrososphaerota archaeon]